VRVRVRLLECVSAHNREEQGGEENLFISNFHSDFLLRLAQCDSTDHFARFKLLRPLRHLHKKQNEYANIMTADRYPRASLEEATPNAKFSQHMSRCSSHLSLERDDGIAPSAGAQDDGGFLRLFPEWKRRELKSIRQVYLLCSNQRKEKRSGTSRHRHVRKLSQTLMSN